MQQRSSLFAVCCWLAAAAVCLCAVSAAAAPASNKLHALSEAARTAAVAAAVSAQQKTTSAPITVADCNYPGVTQWGTVYQLAAGTNMWDPVNAAQHTQIYATFDLGSAVALQAVHIYCYNDVAHSCKNVQLSYGSTATGPFTLALAVQLAISGSSQTISGFSPYVNARYWRLTIVDTWSSDGWQPYVMSYSMDTLDAAVKPLPASLSVVSSNYPGISQYGTIQGLAAGTSMWDPVNAAPGSKNYYGVFAVNVPGSPVANASNVQAVSFVCYPDTTHSCKTVTVEYGFTSSGPWTLAANVTNLPVTGELQTIAMSAFTNTAYAPFWKVTFVDTYTIWQPFVMQLKIYAVSLSVADCPFAGTSQYGTVTDMLNGVNMWNAFTHFSQNVFPIWATLDMGTRVSVSSVAVKCFEDSTHSCQQIQWAYADNVKGPFTLVSDATLPVSSSEQTVSSGFAPANSGRYWRFSILSTYGGWQPYVNSLHIFAYPTQPVAPVAAPQAIAPYAVYIGSTSCDTSPMLLNYTGTAPHFSNEVSAGFGGQGGNGICYQGLSMSFVFTEALPVWPPQWTHESVQSMFVAPLPNRPNAIILYTNPVCDETYGYMTSFFSWGAGGCDCITSSTSGGGKYLTLKSAACV